MWLSKSNKRNTTQWYTKINGSLVDLGGFILDPPLQLSGLFHIMKKRLWDAGNEVPTENLFPPLRG